MRTVICHFRNEEYLLPFWLRHHRELFDHGVMIDYHSTDRSRDIIRELVPDWEIVPSMYKTWDHIDCDFEVMLHERRFEGWKMALNVTEFLCTASLADIEKRVMEEGKEGALARGVIMLDSPKLDLPDPDPSLSLAAQRFYGFYEDHRSWRGLFSRFGIHFPPKYKISHHSLNLATRPYFITRRQRQMLRSRLYHRADRGAYLNGRHVSELGPYALPPQPDLLVLYFYYSPANEAMKARASRQADILSPRMRASHEQTGKWHRGHLEAGKGRYDKTRRRMLRRYGTRDMRHDPVFAAATAPWQRQK